jgi:hypothetical protein
MGETVFRIAFGDFQTIRAKCNYDGCGFVLEVPLGQLARIMNSNMICPCCQKAWWVARTPTGQANPNQSPFTQLQDALIWTRDQINITLEFVVSKSAVEKP